MTTTSFTLPWTLLQDPWIRGLRNFVLVVISVAFVCCDLVEQKSIIKSTATGTSSNDGYQIDGTAAVAIAVTGFYLRRSVGVFRLFLPRKNSMKYFYILLSECNTTLFRSLVVVVLVVMVRFCTNFPTFPLFVPPKWCIRELLTLL